MSDATALAAAIAEGRTTASAAMEAALDMARTQVGFGAVVGVLPDEAAMELARDADRVPRASRGPFHGVPFLAKDLGSPAAGLAPVAGSRAVRERVAVPAKDSALFARFREAGLLPFGLTTVPEFGLALSSEPCGMAPARNPFAPDRSPGGSSGGAAAAVASGIVAMAHATDAAGSIRVPAACCGLYGLKPSRGKVPQGPDFSNHLMGLASELVLARSLRDVATAFSVATALPATDPGEVCGAPPTVGVGIPERCSAACASALHAAAAAFGDAGFTVVDVDAPDAFGAACQSVARRVLSVSLAEWLDALDIPDAEVPPVIAATARDGRAMSGTDVFSLTREIARLTDAAKQLFAKVDAILSPVLSGPPPKLGHFDRNLADTAEYFARMDALAPNAALANVAGLPALAFPVGMSDGLPMGALLLGPHGSDQALLDIVARLAGHLPEIVFPYPVAGAVG